jgi:hypothetical protein
MTKSVFIVIDRKASAHESYDSGSASASRSFPISDRATLYAYIARQDEAKISVQLSGSRQAKIVKAIESTGVSVEVTKSAVSFVELRTRRVA